jgi:O-antigen/teichoic acid export membrane protein
VSAFGVLLNITLNLLLIPKYQAIGAALSSVVTQFTMALLQVLLSFKHFKIVIEIKNTVSFLVFVFVGIAIAVISTKLFNSWFFGFIFSLGGLVLLAFVVRIFKLNEILMFLQKGNKS